MKKHLGVLDVLAEIIHLTRIADRNLTTEQEQSLADLGKRYIEARRAVLDGKVPTPKDMVVAYEIPYYANLLHSLGEFGTDGLEHLHQLITATKAKTRSIANPERRATSTGKALVRTQQTNKARMLKDKAAGEEREAKKAKVAKATGSGAAVPKGKEKM